MKSTLALPGFLLLAPLIALQAAHAQSTKPNIVFILADDLGYGDIGCYGATKVKTPNIDRLARDGMRFTDAHAPASVCTPSRYNLLTGRYCWRTWAGHGTIWANDPLLIEEGRLTLASLLKDAGYFTGCVGKWHLGFGRPGAPGWDDLLGQDFNGELKPGPLEVGFDYFYGMPAVGQHPNIFIEGRRVVGLKADDPIQFVDDPRPEYRVPYLQRPRTAPTNLQMASGKSAEYAFDDAAIQLTEKAVAFIEQHRAGPFFLYLAHRNIHAPLRPNARFNGTSEIGTYGDFIHELDWSVGEVLAALDRLKLADNTLVLFSSDNGGVKEYKRVEHAEIKGHRINGPLRGQKTEVYEGGHREPFLARWPGHVKAATESRQLIALTDVIATCADLLGVALPRDGAEDSISFAPALLGRPGTQDLRQSLVNDSMMGTFSIREGPWKLIAGQGGGGSYPQDRSPAPSPPADAPPGQLYNLDDDLGETKNLYNEKPELVTKLTALLDKL
ncbi:MAG: arylsulfatase, partial [Verrucomicrobia bacterium]|nr:arylsulfatase [Verrucomicrobiota bacterium]